jgi:cytochrome c oxidase assembly protein subunit 15
MLMGGYVKAIGAGLSCPDWPLCYGKFFPFFGSVETPGYTPWQVFAEWFHRLWASFVGFVLLGIVYQARKYRQDAPLLFSLGVICVALFGVQVLLGGLTVIGDLNEFIVVAHLANAILIIMLEMTIAFISFIYSGGLNLKNLPE